MIAVAVIGLLLAQQVPPRDARPATATGATARITGVVVTDDAPARPLRRARVTLGGAALDAPRTAVTADNGTFVLDGIPPGRFTIGASKEAYVGMSHGASRPGRLGTGIHLAAGQTLNVTLRLPRGAVITGTVLDVDGRPAVGVSVSALSPRAVSAFYERVYATALGTVASVTDDRGVYRIYGLPAGEYVVSAQPFMRPPVLSPEIRMMLPGNAVSRTLTMAQVFHPGSADLGRASRVAVRAGEERGGIDVQLEYVPLASVSGTVSAPAGWSPPRVTLWLTDESAQPPGGAVATADEQGRFVFRGIRPGNYRIAARSTQIGASGRGSAVVGDAQYATAEVAVNGEDVDGIALSLQPGLTIAGRVVLEGTRAIAPPSLPSLLNVTAPFTLGSAYGGWPMPPVILSGDTFRINGLVPGPYRTINVAQGIRMPLAGTWFLKSIVAGGRDLLDAPLTLQQNIDDAVVTFTDQASEISGTLRDAQGAPAPELWVVAFPVDRTGWFPNSRRIAYVHPNRDGQWRINNLPPGDYRLVAGDYDPSDWFDPAVLDRLLPTGTPVRITGPEKSTVDLVVR